MNVQSWFDNKNVESIPVLELMESLCGEDMAKSIGLPPFQREVVWDDNRVELLWDSLLQGFPIGSLLFVSPKDSPRSSNARLLQESAAELPKEATDEPSICWLLIDGQQRCMSIGLGNFSKRENGKRATARLWLDLGGVGHKPEKQFPFYLCTRAHPWGREATESEKVGARFQLKDQTDLWKKALGASGDYNDRYPDRWLDLEYTWPVKASQPVPVAELIEAVLKKDYARELNLDDLKPSVCHLEWWKDLNQEARTKLRGILETVEKAVKSLKDYYVVAIRVAPRSAEQELDLGEIFTRLNGQGVTMTGGDLFYSAMKAEWPDAHNLVTRIYKDEETGSVLSPVQIIHAATRLVVVRPGKGESSGQHLIQDPVSLNLQTFRLLMRQDRGESQSFLSSMKSYLELGQDGTGRLHHTLKIIRHVLGYYPEDANDPGLPLPLLAKLNWQCWHLLMAWADKREKPEVEASRMEMIRFALMFHFFMRSYPVQAMKEAFEIARKSIASSLFPGEKISQRLRRDGHLYAEGVLSPVPRQNHKAYSGILMPNEYKELLENDEKKPIQAVLCRERDLLLWSQRKWVHKWFAKIYDPLLYVKTEDLPFDLDHIVPAHHMDGRAVKDFDKELFDDFRNGLLSSVGNLRVWPRSLNRSEQESDLDKRYLFGPAEETLPQDAPHLFGEWDMPTYGKVRSASVFSQEEAELSLWKLVCKSSEGHQYKYVWPRKRLEDFRDAVNKRRARLYADMHSTVGFDEWAAEGEVES